jgi:hypothetical protein
MAKLSIMTLYTRRLNKCLKKWEEEIETRFAELRKETDAKFDKLEARFNSAKTKPRKR